MRQWTLISFLCIMAGALLAEESPTNVPDPFGLGERLALVDYLRDTLHIKFEEGATIDDLRKLYWEKCPRLTDANLDQIQLRDAKASLRSKLLADYSLNPPADADLPALKKMFEEAQDHRAARKITEMEKEEAKLQSERQASERQAKTVAMAQENLEDTKRQIAADRADLDMKLMDLQAQKQALIELQGKIQAARDELTGLRSTPATSGSKHSGDAPQVEQNTSVLSDQEMADLRKNFESYTPPTNIWKFFEDEHLIRDDSSEKEILQCKRNASQIEFHCNHTGISFEKAVDEARAMSKRDGGGVLYSLSMVIMLKETEKFERDNRNR